MKPKNSANAADIFAFDEAKTAPVPTPGLLRHVPDTVIEFCFRNLEHTETVAVRHASAQCLGVLSDFFLQNIITLFVKSANSVKKDFELREYATYQHAVQYINFNFSTEETIDCTVHYLHNLLAVHLSFSPSLERTKRS